MQRICVLINTAADPVKHAFLPFYRGEFGRSGHMLGSKTIWECWNPTTVGRGVADPAENMPLHHLLHAENLVVLVKLRGHN